MLCGGLVGKALQVEQVFLCKVIDIGNILDQTFFKQLIDQGLAHAVNVHYAARREMQNRAEKFCGTVSIDAAIIDFTLHSHSFRVAYQARLGRRNILISARMILIHFDHFRDHVAAPLDANPVADLYAEAFNLVHVVQSSIADGCAADGNWSQFRYGRELAGAASLPANIFQLCDTAARRIFIGNRPARRFPGESEFILKAGTVYLDYDPIDFIGQRVTLLFPLPDEGPNFVHGVNEFPILIDLESGSSSASSVLECRSKYVRPFWSRM